jgi:hypothetical protein
MVSIATQTDLSQINILKKLAAKNPNCNNSKPETIKSHKNKVEKPKESLSSGTPQKKEIKQGPLSKKIRKKRSLIFNPKTTPTFKDFLKNRPISPPAISCEVEDPVKLYVSEGEDMSTDYSAESEAEVANTAPH